MWCKQESLHPCSETILESSYKQKELHLLIMLTDELAKESSSLLEKVECKQEGNPKESEVIEQTDQTWEHKNNDADDIKDITTEKSHNTTYIQSKGKEESEKYVSIVKISKEARSAQRPSTADNMMMLGADDIRRPIFYSFISIQPKLIKKCGGGASSEVYQGIWINQMVALKVFKDSIKDQSIMKEVHMHSTLRHPNIVQYIGYIVLDNDSARKNSRCIIMEWLEGGSLFDSIHLLAKRLKPKQNILSIERLASAMYYLHFINRRHCDFNSKNVLISANGVVKVEWMSPEMIKRECKSLEKNDVYSFAVVMSEIIYGIKPFAKCKSEGEVKKILLKGGLPLPNETSAIRTYSNLITLMSSCLSHNPDERPTFKKLDFDPTDSTLRLSGQVIEENKWVKLGAYHTLELTTLKKILLHKPVWDQVSLMRLDQSMTEKRCQVTVIVMQEGLANICLISDSMMLTKAHITQAIPRKRKASLSGHEKSMRRFFEAIYDTLIKSISLIEIKAIIIASPGFLKDQFMEFMSEHSIKIQDSIFTHNKEKFILVHSSSGHRHAINEILMDKSVQSVLGDVKATAEVAALENFFMVMKKDPNRAIYGNRHVKIAAQYNAVSKLLISDDIFRAPNVNIRRDCMALVEQVKAANGQVHIFSSMHISGERLSQMCGIAAILYFPLPNLDDQIGDDNQYPETTDFSLNGHSITNNANSNSTISEHPIDIDLPSHESNEP